MKIIKPYDIIFGVNDMSHFIHSASDQKEGNISLKDFFKQTEQKRKWSIVNPGFVLANAYSYFVFGQEHKLLDKFDLSQFLSSFIVSYPNYKDIEPEKKSKLLKRRLRNAIAHCHYRVEIRTEDGKISKDGNLWFVFEDQKKDGSDKITMEISFPNFGNLIEVAGQHTIKELQNT